MFKKRIIFLLLLFLGLVFIIYPLYSLTKKEASSKNQVSGVQIKKPFPKLSPTPNPTLKVPLLPTLLPVTPTQTPTATPAPTMVPTPTPTPVQNQQNQSFQVNVSINGGGSFNVNVDSGNNQCDVLRKTLEQGKISSLNMKYDNNLGTDAVYQINGVGKDNSVWWTYTVNGVSPAQGCSYIKANSGDKVEWKYIGS